MSLRVLKFLWILIVGVVCRCHNDNVLFRFFIDRILFSVLSDRVLFESSVIESSSRFTVLDCFYGSPMLFSRHVARVFLSNRATIIFIRNTYFVLNSLYSKKISLTFFNNFTKSDREKINEENDKVI